MRNKKYRSWKIIMVLWVIAMACVVFLILFPTSSLERTIILVGSGLIVLVAIFLFPMYFEVQMDRIIVRQGVWSSNKSYESSGYKKRVFMFDDIKDIEVEGKKVLRIYLKDGNNVGISIMGCIRKNEIIGLIYEVRAQIKGYEQQYI